jgi:hypothetical protein
MNIDQSIYNYASQKMIQNIIKWCKKSNSTAIHKILSTYFLKYPTTAELYSDKCNIEKICYEFELIRLLLEEANINVLDTNDEIRNKAEDIIEFAEDVIKLYEITCHYLNIYSNKNLSQLSFEYIYQSVSRIIYNEDDESLQIFLKYLKSIDE